MSKKDLLSREELSVVDLVSEGPIEGPVDKDGVVINGGKKLYESIYINGVPVKNFDKETYNFRYVAAQFRKGNNDQLSLATDGAIGHPFKTQNTTTQTKRKIIGPYGAGEDTIAASEDNGGVPASFYIENPNVSKVTLTFLFRLSEIQKGNEKRETKTIPTAINFAIEWGVEGSDFNNPIKVGQSKVVVSSAQVFNLDSDQTGGTDTKSYAESLVTYPNEYISLSALSTSGAKVSFEVDLSTADKDYLQSNPKGLNRVLKVHKLSGEGTEEDKGESERSIMLDTVTEHVPCDLSYPGSALISTTIDSRGFSGTPSRSFDLKLLKVKVPQNYTPWTETTSVGDPLYNENWNGTFSTDLKWTCNPAWVFYDLMTNPKHGLGRFGIEPYHIDKWSLYEIARYCDAVDDDGNFVGVDGATNDSEGDPIKEPRFTCNVLIEQKQEAYDLLYNLASIFNGMVYWGFGGIFTISDKPKDPIMFFSNSDVSDAGFNYADSQKTTRITAVKTRYNDASDDFKSKIEYVEDADAIRKFGIIEKDLIAFACTSKGQAQRLAKWILETSQRQKETIAFTTGLKGLYLRPGDVFRVFDELDNDIKISGRILYIDHASDKIKIDIPLIDSQKLSKIQIMTAKADIPSKEIEDFEEFEGSRPSLIEEYLISNIADDLTTLTLTDSSGNSPNLIDIDVGFPWMIVDEDVYPQEEVKLYKVININQEAGGQVSILGLEYNKNKYENIDNNKNIEEKKFEFNSDILVSKGSIADPIIKSFEVLPSSLPGTNQYKLLVQFYLVPSADSYEVRFYKDGILLNNLTERIVPSEKNISNSVLGDPDAEKFIQITSWWWPPTEHKYVKTEENYELTCQVSAIKNGKYSDSDSMYNQLD
jgi:hypothetical protein